MLGASFLLGGVRYHVQEFNSVAARFQAGLLFLATIALLIPSAVAAHDSLGAAGLTQNCLFGDYVWTAPPGSSACWPSWFT